MRTTPPLPQIRKEPRGEPTTKPDVKSLRRATAADTHAMGTMVKKGFFNLLELSVLRTGGRPAQGTARRRFLPVQPTRKLEVEHTLDCAEDGYRNGAHHSQSKGLVVLMLGTTRISDSLWTR